MYEAPPPHAEAEPARRPQGRRRFAYGDSKLVRHGAGLDPATIA